MIMLQFIITVCVYVCSLIFVKYLFILMIPREMQVTSKLNAFKLSNKVCNFSIFKFHWPESSKYFFKKKKICYLSRISHDSAEEMF